jgi:hypothetical protein
MLKKIIGLLKKRNLPKKQTTKNKLRKNRIPLKVNLFPKKRKLIKTESAKADTKSAKPNLRQKLNLSGQPKMFRFPRLKEKQDFMISLCPTVCSMQLRI